MKKIVLFLSLSLVVQISLAGSEPSLVEKKVSDDKNVAFLFNPLQILFLTLGTNFEVGVSKKISLVIPFSVTFISGSVTVNGKSGSSSYLFGLSSGFGAKFHLNGEVFKDSLYIKPVLNIGWLKFGDSGVNTYAVSPSSIIGYQWAWDSGFLINLGLGVQYTFVGVKAQAENGVFALHGVLPAGEFALGYAW